MSWPNVPSDVVDWFRDCFRAANEAVTTTLDNVPNIREPSLDDKLIEALIPRSAPTRLPSDTVVSMDIHNIGGLRSFSKWETADIAVIVHVLVRGTPIGRKIGLLQAKRLYPYNAPIDELDPFDFRMGMNRFFWPEPKSAARALYRDYTFNGSCRYRSFDDDQHMTISDFNSQFGEAIYYLFYNPSKLPMRIKYPIESYRTSPLITLGCRVSTAEEVGIAAKRVRGSGGPTRRAIAVNSAKSDWRLEYWAADLLLTCKVGRTYDASDEQLIYRLVERRSGPIGAAIRTTIDLQREPIG